MHWLRSALLYLFVTVLLCAGIWLFWGEAISQRLKSEKPYAQKETAHRIAGAAKEKTATMKKLKPGELAVKAEQSAATGKQAWEKASSGFLLLLQAAGDENRRLLLETVAEQDRRYRALFAKSVGQRPSAQQAK